MKIQIASAVLTCLLLAAIPRYQWNTPIGFIDIGYLVLWVGVELPFSPSPLTWFVPTWNATYVSIPLVPLYLAAMWALVIRSFKIQDRENDFGTCSGCGYLLHGIKSKRCPECGKSVVRDKNEQKIVSERAAKVVNRVFQLPFYGTIVYTLGLVCLGLFYLFAYLLALILQR